MTQHMSILVFNMMISFFICDGGGGKSIASYGIRSVMMTMHIRLFPVPVHGSAGYPPLARPNPPTS